MATPITFGSVELDTVLIFIFVFIAAIIAGNIIYSLLRNLLEKRLTKRQSKILSRTVEYVIVIAGLYIGLVRVLGLDLTAFTASLGIMGVVIAFSSTQIIQNTLAGLLIMLQRPIQLEDWIEIGAAGETAVSKVKEVSLMRTTLRNKDGKIIYIPNNVLLTSRITNYTKSGFVEIPIPLIIPKESDYEQIKNVIMETVNKHPKVLPNVSRTEKQLSLKLIKFKPVQELFGGNTNLNNLQPYIIITDISNNKISLSIRMWIREINLRERIVSEVLENITAEMEKKKIII